MSLVIVSKMPEDEGSIYNDIGEQGWCGISKPSNLDFQISIPNAEVDLISLSSMLYLSTIQQIYMLATAG